VGVSTGMVNQIRNDAVGAGPRRDYSLYGALVGATSILILLQGVWAGVFIRPGRPNDDTWVVVHDWGARTAIVFSVLSLLFVLWRLRSRRDLVIGTAALFVLLFLEAYIGGEVFDSPWLETIHFPLAMALLGLSVWLPVRARMLRRRA
jgi:heme A synthase